MRRTDWLSGIRSALVGVPRRRKGRTQPVALRRCPGFEPLEDRRLLAVDFGDAPDLAAGTTAGNYQTLSTDNGPSHTIVVGLRLGANVDGDGGALQNGAANADDVNGALPDDEDGVANPAADLVLTIGAQPTVSVRVTNTTGAPATLYGWIDVNANGVFDNAAERASAAVPSGSNNVVKTLTFAAVPTGFTGTTYARFRLSTDAAAANATGAAADGEVEDYRVTITKPSTGLADGAKTKKVASNTNGGPTLVNSDYFGRAVAAIGDIDGDGVTDLAVGANGDDTGGSARGAVHVLFMNTDGTVKGRQKIANIFNNISGGLANGDYFGSSVTSLGDLDGDGVTDLAVGAERDEKYTLGGTNRGAVYVLYLNSNGTLKENRRIAGSGDLTLANGDYFGRSVASIGDLDGDGVTDLAVGAYGDDTGGSARGAVHVLFMNANGTVKSTQKIASGIGGGPALANSDQFGSSLASLGDLDGDGITELAVGAIGDDTGGNARGAIHVLFLNANGTVKSSQKIGSGTGGGPTLGNGNQFGASAAALGDVDGDGLGDLAVGANYDATGGTNRGAVHVLLLNAVGGVKATTKIASGVGGGPTLANDDRFGVSIASLGDLDGDGLTDLAVGANFDDTGGTNRGSVHILFLNAPPANTNPFFTSPNTANVPENTTAVMTVAATDADLPAQTVTYSIVGGIDQAKFGITSGGALTFNSAPDFEAPTDFNHDNVYMVAVQASDGVGGTTLQTISVTVTQANDNPVFTSPNTANVPENNTAAMTVTATDIDFPQQVVTYSIVGGADQSRFSISTGFGNLSFLAAPNFEAPADADGDNVYEVTVQANDGAGGTTLQTINVIVTQANDNPVFTSTSIAIVPENTAAVLTLTATDEDLPAQAMTFSIVGGDDQARFGVTSGGALSFNAAPNFEAPTDANGDNLYLVTVQASDGHGGTAIQTIGVFVTLLNDNSPVFTSPNTASVTENTTAVMTVTATDADLPVQLVTFSIVGGVDQARFGITSGGALSFNTAPSFDAPTDANGDNVYIVTIEASDGNGGTALQTINITVTPHARDFGDAPDAVAGTSAGNYQTRSADNGPRHLIVPGLRMGASVDSDGGALQNAAANADDTGGALPDDEDGLNNPAADLTLTVGAQPTVNAIVTNFTGSAATLYGWIDYNANGVFENASERASAAVSNGTSNVIITLTFPAVPSGFTGATYARFRLSTNVAASNPTGLAPNGEVEDYRVMITKPTSAFASGGKTVKIAHNTSGGPALANGDTFGSASASIGDLDGDGVTDLAVGAQSTAYGGNSGAVYILFMNANGTVKANQKIASGVGGGPALANGDFFGRSIAAIGDLDGDGVVDLAVGADRDDTGGANRGAVHILFMNANGTVKGSQKIASSVGGGPILANSDVFGDAVTSLGDLDGDGVADLAVAAAGDDTGGAERGAVYVLLMNPNGTVKASQKIAHGTGGGPVLANTDLFGSALAGLGDMDGDGITDLAVGAFGDDTGGAGRGAAYVLFLNPNGTVKASQKIAHSTGGGPALANDDFFGSSAAALGDLDGDGVADLGVGARYDDAGGTDRGAIHVLFMNANGTVKATQKIASGVGGGPVVANGDLFGRSFTSLGDLDGDGLPDLAVGTERDDTGGTNRGAVHMLFLRSTIPGDFDLDGVVESAELSLWKANFGTTGGPTVTTGDADEDRDVDGRDFLLWQQNLGMSIGSTANAAPTDVETIAEATADARDVVTVGASLASQSIEPAGAPLASSRIIASNRNLNALATLTPPASWQIDVGRKTSSGSRSRYSPPLDYEAISWRIADNRRTTTQAAYFRDLGEVDGLLRFDASTQAPEEDFNSVIAMDVALTDLFDN